MRAVLFQATTTTIVRPEPGVPRFSLFATRSSTVNTIPFLIGLNLWRMYSMRCVRLCSGAPSLIWCPPHQFWARTFTLTKDHSHPPTHRHSIADTFAAGNGKVPRRGQAFALISLNYVFISTPMPCSIPPCRAVMP